MRAICALSHIAVLPKDTHLGRAAFATVPDLSNPRSLRWAKSSSHQSSRIRSACVKTLALSRFSCADKPLKQSTVLTFPLSKFASVRTALQLFAETRRSFRTLATMAVGQNSDTFFLDKFAFRQFEGGHAGQLKISKENFVREVNSRCTKDDLVDGYAPFCKHVFVPNFAEATLNSLPIDDSNSHMLASGYSKRRPEELAVLTRWFPKDKVETREAKFLDVILYSREQILKEREAMPEEEQQDLPDAPWGIISIKAQDEDHETPMQPITIMRNSLGPEEGGSGVALDKKAYEASVEYWQSHAPIIAGNPSGE